MNDYVTEVTALLARIREDIKQEMLESIGAASSGTQPARKRPGPKPGRQPQSTTQRPTTPRPKGAKRSPEDIEALTRNLLAYVKKHSGQRIEQIAAGLSVTTGDLALPAKKLLAEKKLKTAGQKRGTTYQAR